MKRADDVHVPVLLESVLEVFAPAGGGVIVDGTYGGGGHSREIMRRTGARVIAIDRDPDAEKRALGFIGEGLVFVRGCFSCLDVIAEEQGHELVDGVLLDIGVSSFQLDEAGRGFSFMRDGPLDMRMEARGVSAADVVNRLDERGLALIFRYLGEESAARRLASAIVRRRHRSLFSGTLELADLAVQVLGSGGPRHPATRLFQALRIFVNDELKELSGALIASERILRPGGRLAVISFHSLEDRVVKGFLRSRSGLGPGVSRHAPEVSEARRPSFRLKVRRPVRASGLEIEGNLRSRSARLRWAVREEAPAWGEGEAVFFPDMPRLSDLESLAA